MIEALAALARLGLPVFATDGGSDPSFVDAVARLPGLDVQTSAAPGMVAQIRSSLGRAQASGAPRILYTEPDKLDFFTHHVIAFLEAASREPGSSIVLASRSTESLATFPASQQYAETVFNTICGELTGIETDFLYGPFVVDATLVDVVSDELPASIGWGWRPYLFVRGTRAGRRLTAMTGPYSCPSDQRADSPGERLHRVRQLTQNLSGLLLACEHAPVRGAADAALAGVDRELL